MRFSIFVFVLIAFLLNSCNHNEKRRRQDNKAIHELKVKPIIIEYKSQLELYRSGDWIGERTIPEPLNVKKLIYLEKTLFLYEYPSNKFTDTLVFYQDSVKMNNRKLDILNKKVIDFEGSKIEIKKYHYVGDHHISNLYINDSLGIIINLGQGQATVLKEYSTEKYHDLCNKIIEDSLFFHFEIDENLIKKHVNQSSR